MINTLILEIEKLARRKKVVLIAIDGLGGSGKTTLAKLIKKSINNCTIVQLDDFYSIPDQAADLSRLKEQVIIPLHNNHQANYQIYDWRTDTLIEGPILKPEGTIIFEGVYAIDKEIREYFDVKIWIDCPAELGFQRGVARDIQGDGVDNSEKWRNIWMPLEEKYLLEQEPEKHADYVLNGAEFEKKEDLCCPTRACS